MDEDKEGKGPPNKISQTEAVVIGGNLLAVHSSVVRIECVPSFRRFDIESREATLDGPQLVVTYSHLHAGKAGLVQSPRKEQALDIPGTA